jgi:hypothetical protein
MGPGQEETILKAGCLMQRYRSADEASRVRQGQPSKYPRGSAMFSSLIRSAGPRVFAGRAGGLMVLNRQFASTALPHMAGSPLGRLATGAATSAASGASAGAAGSSGTALAARVMAGLGTLVAVGNSASNAATVVDHVRDYSKGDISGAQAAFGISGACMGIAGSWTTSTLWGFAYAAGALNCFVFRHGLGGEKLASPDSQVSAAVDVSNALFGVLVSGTSGATQLAGTAVGAAVNAKFSNTANEVVDQMRSQGAQLVVSAECTLAEAGARLGHFVRTNCSELDAAEAWEFHCNPSL